MSALKIETFDGNTFEGFKISHPKELPKSAMLHCYTYSIDYNTTYSIYRSYTKKGTKTFIFTSKY